MKVCSKCKEIKTHEDFSRRSASIDGLQHKCKLCEIEYRRKYYESNSESCKLTVKKWQANNVDRCRTNSKDWIDNNWYRKNESRKSWQKNNPDRANHSNAKRRSSKLNATPSWLTEEHNKQIANIYWLAKDLETVCGQQYHVDHIVPLQGQFVCGLHVPWNLQILPADINLSKSNTHAV